MVLQSFTDATGKTQTTPWGIGQKGKVQAGFDEALKMNKNAFAQYEKDHDYGAFYKAAAPGLKAEFDSMANTSSVDEVTNKFEMQQQTLTDMRSEAKGFGGAVKESFKGVAKGLLNAGAWALTSFVIEKAVTGIDSAVRSTERLIDKSEEVKSNWQEMNKSQETAAELAEKQSDRFTELSKQVNQATGENQSLSASEYEEYNSLREQIAASFPSLVDHYDSEGRAVIKYTATINGLKDAYAELEKSNRQQQSNEFAETVGKASWQELYGDAALWGDFQGGLTKKLNNLDAFYQMLQDKGTIWSGELLNSQLQMKGFDSSGPIYAQLMSELGYSDFWKEVSSQDPKVVEAAISKMSGLVTTLMTTTTGQISQSILPFQQEMQRQLQGAFSEESFKGISEEAKSAMLSATSIFDDASFFEQFGGDGGINAFKDWVGKGVIAPLRKSVNRDAITQLTDEKDKFLKGATSVFDYETITGKLVDTLKSNGVGSEFLDALMGSIMPSDTAILRAHAAEVFGKSIEEIGKLLNYKDLGWVYENLSGVKSAQISDLPMIMEEVTAEQAQTFEGVSKAYAAAAEYESNLNELVKTFNETGNIDWDKYASLDDAGKSVFRQDGLGQWKADASAADEVIKNHYADEIKNSESVVKKAKEAGQETQKQLKKAQKAYDDINKLKLDGQEYDAAELSALEGKTAELQKQLATSQESTKQAEMQLAMLKTLANGEYSYSVVSQYSESGDDARANKGATDIVGEGLKTGRRYTRSFDASADYLFGADSGWENWSDKQINAAYKNRAKYWSKDGNADPDYFWKQAKKIGAASYANGEYSMNKGWNIDKLSDALGMSAQMLRDVIGGVNEFIPDKDKIKVEGQDEQPKTPEQTKQDAAQQAAQQAYSSIIAAINNVIAAIRGLNKSSSTPKGSAPEDDDEEKKIIEAQRKARQDATDKQVKIDQAAFAAEADKAALDAERRSTLEHWGKVRDDINLPPPPPNEPPVLPTPAPTVAPTTTPTPPLTPGPTNPPEVTIPNANVTIENGGTGDQPPQTSPKKFGPGVPKEDDIYKDTDWYDLTGGSEGNFGSFEEDANQAASEAAKVIGDKLSGIQPTVDTKSFVAQSEDSAKEAGSEAGNVFSTAIKSKTEDSAKDWIDSKSVIGEGEAKPISVDATEAVAQVAQLNDAITAPAEKTMTSNIPEQSAIADTMNAKLAAGVTKVVTIVYKDPGWNGGGIGNKIVPPGKKAGVDGISLAGGTRGARAGNTLVGEIAPEIIVNRKSGTWRLASFPQFTKLSRGDIVFNGNDTKKILAGDSGVGFGGVATVDGTKGGKSYAYTKGVDALGLRTVDVEAVLKGKYKKPKGGGGGSGGSSGGGGGGDSPVEEAVKEAAEAAKDKFDNLFDWIERALEVAKDATDKLIKAAKEKVGYIAKNAAVDVALISNKSQLDKNQAGYDKYMSKLDEINAEYKLSDDIIKKIKEGDIAIEEYDEDTKKHIKSYEDWYSKAEKCLETIEDLKDQERELNLNKLEYINDYYEAKLDRLDARADLSDARLDYKSTFGQQVTADDYTDALAATQEKVTQLIAARTAYDAQFQALMASGVLVADSDDWHEYIGTLEEFDQQIVEANISVQELNDSIADINITNLEWALKVLTDAQDKFEGIIDFHDAQGTDNIDSYYSSLINNGMEQIANLQAQNEELRAQQKGLDVLSKKYQEIQETLSGNEQTIWDIKTSQESWNDAIADLRIKKLEEERRELEKTNDAYKAKMELEDALEDLERAKSQKNKLVYHGNGVGYVYEADKDDIRDKQDRVDELRHEEILRKIDDTIDAIEEAKKTDNVYNYEGTDVVKLFATADATAEKLYNLVTSTADLEAMVAGGIAKQTSNMLGGASGTPAVTISIGDINLSGVQDVNTLADSIVNQLPNIMLQKLYSK